MVNNIIAILVFGTFFALVFYLHQKKGRILKRYLILRKDHAYQEIKNLIITQTSFFLGVNKDYLCYYDVDVSEKFVGLRRWGTKHIPPLIILRDQIDKGLFPDQALFIIKSKEFNKKKEIVVVLENVKVKSHTLKLEIVKTHEALTKWIFKPEHE